MAFGSRIREIEITKNPTKQSYLEGESFDASGMEVTARCDNGLTREITGAVAFSKDPLTTEYTDVEIRYERQLYNDTLKSYESFDPVYAPVEVFVSKESDREAAKKAEELIAQISFPIRMSSKEEIKAALLAYENLELSAEAEVSNAELLAKAKKEYEELMSSLLAKSVEGASANRLGSTVTITIPKLSYAKSVAVFRRKKGEASYQKLAEQKPGETWIDANLPAGTWVEYQLQAFGTVDVLEEKTKAGGKSDILVVNLPPKGITALSTKQKKTTSIVLSWNAASGADGYEVCRRLLPSGKYQSIKRIKGGNVTRLTDTKRSVGKTYSYQIKAFSYGKDGTLVWSEAKAKEKKIQLLPDRVGGLKILKKKNRRILQWKQVKGIKGYQVLVSRKKNSGYRQAALLSSKKKKLTISLKKWKWAKVRGYVLLGKTKLYGKASKPGALK